MGGTNVVSDANGTLEQTLSYYPFGSTRINAKQGSFDERNKFTGHMFDDVTGLYYMQARYQNPAIGRFVSEDPSHLALGDAKQLKQLTGQDQKTYLIDPQQLNSYSYVANNPVSRTDPTGNAFGVDDLAPFALGGTVGVAVQASACLVTGQQMTWGDVGGAFVTGGIVGWGAENAIFTGGASAAVASAVIYGGLGGFGGNLTKQGIDLSTGAQKDFSAGELAANTSFGAVTAGVTEGFLPAAKIPGLSSGRGNMNAVGQRLQTQMTKGTIGSMSLRSAARSAYGSQASAAYRTSFGGVAAAAWSASDSIAGYSQSTASPYSTPAIINKNVKKQ